MLEYYNTCWLMAAQCKSLFTTAPMCRGCESAHIHEMHDKCTVSAVVFHSLHVVSLDPPIMWVFSWRACIIITLFGKCNYYEEFNHWRVSISSGSLLIITGMTGGVCVCVCVCGGTWWPTRVADLHKMDVNVDPRAYAEGGGEAP